MSAYIILRAGFLCWLCWVSLQMTMVRAADADADEVPLSTCTDLLATMIFSFLSPSEGQLGGLCLTANQTTNVTAGDTAGLSCTGELECCQASSTENICQRNGCAKDNGGCGDICVNYGTSGDISCGCSKPELQLDPQDNKTCIAVGTCKQGFQLNYAASPPKCVQIQPIKVGYTEAVFNCILQGLAPLSLESQDDVDWLQHVRATNPEYDVDLWLGGQVTQPEFVSWLTELYALTKPVSYSNWDLNEPSCLVYDGCHMLSKRNGYWSMEKSNSKTNKFNYACQIGANLP